MGIKNFVGSNPTVNGSPPPQPPIIPTVTSASSNDEIKELALSMLIDYNKKYATAGTALFREEVVCQTMACLIGKDKPNALLVGQAGVGKTKIAEDIAYRIVNNDPLLPDSLKRSTIYELQLSTVVAGSSLVGSLEEKVKAIIEFVSRPHEKAILFIDEIHQLVGENASQTYEKIAQILKPALSRGTIKVIGATTLQESTALMDDPALNRRFSRIIVDELTQQQTVEILRMAKVSFFNHYDNKIAIPDTILEPVVFIADQYKTAGSHRPDNALTLLDRTIADTVIGRKIKERDLQNQPQLLQALQSVQTLSITESQLRKTAFRLMSGNAKQEIVDKDTLQSDFSSIKGQDKPIDLIIDAVLQHQSPYFPKNKPLTMLFLGTSGVGKTEVVKILANRLTGVKPITLNMGEFHSPASINRIIGAPAGYIGSDSNGELPFDSLEANPYQVILLDEFEKCDNAVQRLFMSAFDEGYITTARGQIIDFSKAIIVATTNAGHSVGKIKTIGFNKEDQPTPTASIDPTSLTQWFDMELLNRFTHTLTFNTLTKEEYKIIVNDIYEKEVARIKRERPYVILDDTLTDNILNTLVNASFIKEFGGRPARRTVEQYIQKMAKEP